MAFKIPESPNIVGGQAVLRQPSGIQGTTVTPDFSVDTRAAQGALASVAEAAALFQEEKNAAFMGDLQVEYHSHMAKVKQQVFDNNKGKKAQDLYKNYIKKASDKFYADAIGAPKNDGKVRIANKGLQKRFKNWVDGQQSTYIAQAASYEAQQLEAWRKSVWDAQDSQAATLISSANSDIELQNGIDAIYANTHDMLRGMDERYISQVAATKIDDAMSGFVTQHIVDTPEFAYALMTNNEIVSDALTTTSKRSLLESIRESYEEKAINDYSNYLYSNGKEGSLPDKAVLASIFGITEQEELNSKIDGIRGKARKRSDARAQEVAGVNTAIVTAATNKFRLARSDEERDAALKELSQVQPKAAEAMQNAYETSLYNESLTTMFEGFNKRANIPSGVTPEQIQAVGEFFGLNEKQVQVMQDYADMSNERFNHAEEYTDLMAGISNGTVVGYDPVTMGTLPPDMQMALINSLATQGEYRELSRQLKEVHGVDLDSKLKDIDANYSKLDPSAANALKRNIIEEINKWKNKNKDIPQGDTLNSIILKAQQTALSTEASALQGALQEEYTTLFDALDIDPVEYPEEARKALEKRNLLPLSDIAASTLGRIDTKKSYYGKVSDKTYEKIQGKAKKVLESFSDKLSLKQKMWVEQNEDRLLPFILGGDYKTVVALVQGVI